MAAGHRQAQEDVVRRRCTLEGRVQMVGFRMFATMHAQRLGLRGWVHNDPGGAVVVLVEGPAEPVQAFLKLLHRGPSAAEVTRFTVSEEAVDGTLEDFRAVDFSA
ncbi:MAG TPA: acylphosphatase [Candidatus Dormibacteraeota bacterium]